ncbi:DEAD/DEAH box helicase family protein [Streptomyces daliensis]
MTIETTRADSAGEEPEVIDAEVIEDTRRRRITESLRQRRRAAQAAYEVQRERVRRRVSDWYAAADLDDVQLGEEVVTRRRRAAQGADDRLIQEVARLRARLATAKGRAAAAAGDREARSPEVERLTGLLAAAESRIETRQAEGPVLAVKPASRADIARARWAKKAVRVGGTGLAGVAGLNASLAEPLVLFGVLAAAPFGWWFLAREEEDQEQEHESGGLVPAPVSLVKEGDPQQETGEGWTAVPDGQSYVPDTLAAAGRVSLTKRDAAHVKGESDLVTALVKAGIITEKQRDETHLAGVIRPDGPGWTATVELPRGVVAADAMGKIGDLASALRIKKSRIEMKADSSDEGHEGRFTLWVADADNPYGTGKTASPLIKADRWDFWEQGVPLGGDARAVLHTMHLLWSSLLIGGLMGYGKTYLARLIAAAAVLDPTVRIIVITGKTGPDWAPLRHVAHRWIAGADEETIHVVLSAVGGLIHDMQRRGEELERLYETDPDTVPEGKITRELAAAGMGPVLLIVDELQELLDGAALVRVVIDQDPETGKTTTRPGKELMVEGFARFVRVTRFVGGMGVFITQRPDASSVPTALREVCAKRASFRVKGDRSARMVLGDDAVAAGAAPHLLTEDSRGVVVIDQSGEHITVKSDVIDLPEFKEICLLGRQHRILAGVLTGDAADYGKEDAAAAAVRLLLTDCLAVLAEAGVDRARTERLVELLAAAHHDRYGELTKAQLQARLRDAGAGTTRKLGPIDSMANPNGYLRDQIAAALQNGK